MLTEAVIVPKVVAISLRNIDYLPDDFRLSMFRMNEKLIHQTGH